MSGMKQNNSREIPGWQRKFLSIPVAGLVCLLAFQSAAAQTGTITGVVTDVTSGRTLESALVTLDGAESGVQTNTSGRYIIPGVSAGTHEVTFILLGYEEMTMEVTVTAGGTAQADGALTATALRVQDVVVTGVARGIPRVKLPFTVDKVDIADIPVPPVSAEGWLQGKVAGVKVQSTSGNPGSSSQIMLRAATSIAGSQTPLIIVDNVITANSLTVMPIYTPDSRILEVLRKVFVQQHGSVNHCAINWEHDWIFGVNGFPRRFGVDAQNLHLFIYCYSQFINSYAGYRRKGINWIFVGVKLAQNLKSVRCIFIIHLVCND